ncbi:MAG: hypothetical protein EXR14_02915 [Pelagibacteraceae bacterium]|nr:hypothetical protein [Pelagibacteraceae bacterium]
MSKKIIFFVLAFITLTNICYSAGSSGGSSGESSGESSNKSDYSKAVDLIKSAKKYEKKEQNDQAQERYKKANTLLIKSNSDKPNNVDTLNYLGFTTRKLGDYANGEKYYLEGLAIDPNHKGINEYLGELYVATGRIELANERLSVLESCKCEEYNELKEIIEGIKKSKY